MDLTFSLYNIFLYRGRNQEFGDESYSKVLLKIEPRNQEINFTSFLPRLISKTMIFHPLILYVYIYLKRRKGIPLYVLSNPFLLQIVKFCPFTLLNCTLEVDFVETSNSVRDKYILFSFSHLDSETRKLYIKVFISLNYDSLTIPFCNIFISR